jgi:hypothetical protein
MKRKDRLIIWSIIAVFTGPWFLAGLGVLVDGLAKGDIMGCLIGSLILTPPAAFIIGEWRLQQAQIQWHKQQHDFWRDAHLDERYWDC